MKQEELVGCVTTRGWAAEHGGHSPTGSYRVPEYVSVFPACILLSQESWCLEDSVGIGRNRAREVKKTPRIEVGVTKKPAGGWGLLNWLGN